MSSRSIFFMIVLVLVGCSSRDKDLPPPVRDDSTLTRDAASAGGASAASTHQEKAGSIQALLKQIETPPIPKKCPQFPLIDSSYQRIDVKDIVDGKTGEYRLVEAQAYVKHSRGESDSFVSFSLNLKDKTTADKPQYKVTLDCKEVGQTPPGRQYFSLPSAFSRWEGDYTGQLALNYEFNGDEKDLHNRSHNEYPFEISEGRGALDKLIETPSVQIIAFYQLSPTRIELRYLQDYGSPGERNRQTIRMVFEFEDQREFPGQLTLTSPQSAILTHSFKDIWTQLDKYNEQHKEEFTQRYAVLSGQEDSICKSSNNKCFLHHGTNTKHTCGLNVSTPTEIRSSFLKHSGAELTFYHFGIEIMGHFPDIRWADDGQGGFVGVGNDFFLAGHPYILDAILADYNGEKKIEARETRTCWIIRVTGPKGHLTLLIDKPSAHILKFEFNDRVCNIDPYSSPPDVWSTYIEG
jgi:hypothetical protein